MNQWQSSWFDLTALPRALWWELFNLTVRPQINHWYQGFLGSDWNEVWVDHHVSKYGTPFFLLSGWLYTGHVPYIPPPYINHSEDKKNRCAWWQDHGNNRSQTKLTFQELLVLLGVVRGEMNWGKSQRRWKGDEKKRPRLEKGIGSRFSLHS